MSNFQINLGLDPSDFRRGLSEAERLIQEFQRKLEKISEMGEVFVSIGQKLTLGLTVPLIGLSTAAVKAYADIQALEKGLEAVMGSAGRAGNEFGRLREVAKLPGLGLKEAVQGSVSLQSAGFSASKAREALLAFGNALATVGKGANEMNFVILALTQLQNKASGFGQDLRQLMEQLPQLRSALKSAFGTSDSEEIAKTGVTGAQVVEKLIAEFGKLPKVTGGLKNAFENFKDSVFLNLSRVGEVIDKNLNISNLIDKLTKALDALVSRFENLSPGMQKFVLISAGIAAIIGPLLVGFGGLLLIIPSITSAVTTMAAGWAILSAAMTSATGIIGLLLVAATALGAGIALYVESIETAADRQERFTRSQEKATASAQVEISALDQLYAKTQNFKLSLEERKAAVDEIQKQYPGYFQQYQDEIILTGKASEAYAQLRKDILNASLARAAQSELDKRNEKRLEDELKIRENINKAVALYKDPSLSNLQKANELIRSGLFNFSESINPKNFDESEIKEAAKQYVFKYVKELKKNANAYAKEDNPIFQIIKSGQDAITKLDADFATQNNIPGARRGTQRWYEEEVKRLQEANKDLVVGSKQWIENNALIKKYSELIHPKKDTERQLAELIPKGSIADFQKRSDLLKKSIEYSVDGLVKVRGLDKFGKDKDKNGNPYYTGLVLPIEQAYAELEKLQILSGEIDLEPVNIKGKGFLDQFGNEFKTFGELLSNENIVVQTNLERMATTIDAGALKILEKTLKIKEATEELNKSLSEALQSNIAESVSDAFSAIGSAISSGQNVLQALGSSLISSFGKILSDLGKQMITYGTSLLALKIAMKSLNPYVAIAAGVALVALGSAVSGAVRNQSNSIGGGSTNISSSSGVSSQGYTSNYASGGTGGGGEVVFRIEGRDLVGVLNREIANGNRLNAG